MAKSLLKIFLFLGLIGAMLYFVYYLSSNTPNYMPAPDDTPTNITIVNNWTGRFGLTFETALDTTSAQIALGKSPSNLDIIIDDVNGADHKGKLHLLNATGLDTNQLYYYRILINGAIYDPQAAPSEYNTVNLNTTPFEGQPLAGKVSQAEGVCLVYAHLIVDGATSLPSVEYLAGNGTYTINVDYFLDKTTYNPIDPTNKDILVYAKCQDGRAGGIVTKVSEIMPDFAVNSGYSITSYSNDLTALPGSGVTQTVKPTTITPTPTQPVTRTTTVPISTRPSLTDLPRTGILDDSNPYLPGLLMIALGIYLQYSLSKSKKKIGEI
jgi:hypothetical protein